MFHTSGGQPGKIIVSRGAAAVFAVFLPLAIAAFLPALPQVPPTTRPVAFVADQRLGDRQTLSGNTQYEPTIAVNPLDPGNLVAGFFDWTNTNRVVCRPASTEDGGTTWTVGGPTPLLGDTTFCGDPSIAADLDGRFHYAYFTLTAAGDQAVVVATSSDRGRTFPASTVAVSAVLPSFVDKPYMTVDAWPTSPFKGTIYVTYTTEGPIRIVTSRDGGSTWSAPAPVPEPELVAQDGSIPIVAPDGTAYVFYMTFDGVPGHMGIRFTKSADGGVTWGPVAPVASGLPSPGLFELRNGSPKSATTPGHGFRATSFPTAAAGPDGTLYVAWIDFPNGSCLFPGVFGSPCFDSDVRLSLSRDGGATWSAPVKVSDETDTTDQFFPWIAVHPDGLLSMMWLDKRGDADNGTYNAFYTNTYDGEHFLPNVRVSSVTSTIGSRRFIGDYNGLVATATAVVPVWNDLRFSNDAIFTATGTLGP